MEPHPKRPRRERADCAGVDLLLRAVKERRRVVFVTGAGLSVTAQRLIARMLTQADIGG